jgi:hypothetical protein
MIGTLRPGDPPPPVLGPCDSVLDRPMMRDIKDQHEAIPVEKFSDRL